MHVVPGVPGRVSMSEPRVAPTSRRRAPGTLLPIRGVDDVYEQNVVTDPATEEVIAEFEMDDAATAAAAVEY